MRHFTILASAGLLAGALSGCAGQQPGGTMTAKGVIETRCATCHEAKGAGFYRLNAIRKSPEGWDMTLARMTLWHKVEITPAERRLLVKHFSDTQGLAPSEAAPHRALLERQPGLVESPDDPLLAEICGRCHSNGRYGLQRRNADEWLKLVHTHVGQFPTIEWQALARDRAWWEIATGEAVQKLGAAYGLNSAEWRAWKARPVADLAGSWRITGQRPGKGAYQGSATLTAQGGDNYRVAYQLAYDDGTTLQGSGQAVLYTGYEWRASIDLGGESVREVYALAEDGNTLSGRWFREEGDEIGGNALLVREGTAGARIMAVSPAMLRSGVTTTLSIRGTGLAGAVDLGSGLKVLRTVSADARELRVEVAADADAAVGPRTVRVGASTAEAALAVYRQIDYVAVEPAINIARVGGNGGALPPVQAQFQAVAWLNGPDNQPQTADDLRLGAVPASWTTLDNGEVAAAMADAKFAGHIDQSGLFHPAGAGPNPARPMSTNNAGDLLVQATVDDQGRSVQGQGRLIVTVQRWNDPPIR